MTPACLESIRDFTLPTLNHVSPKEVYIPVVDDDTDVKSKPSLKKVTVQEPASELTHRQTSPTVDQHDLNALPQNHSQPAKTTELRFNHQSLMLMGMAGFIYLVDEYYGLPGVMATLALAQGATIFAESTGRVKPGLGYHAASMFSSATASVCTVSAFTHLTPIPFLGAGLSIAAGSWNQDQEGKAVEKARSKSSPH